MTSNSSEAETGTAKPRIWFKQDMAKAILNGRKTSTTRDHRREIGVYIAVMGDRYHARPFANITITGIEETTWPRVFEEYLFNLKAAISPEISMADAMRIAKADRWLTEMVR